MYRDVCGNLGFFTVKHGFISLKACLVAGWFAAIISGSALIPILLLLDVVL